MNRDLYLSILALDSYNRGYDQRLRHDSGDTTIPGTPDSGDTILNRDSESSLLAMHGPLTAYRIKYCVPGIVSRAVPGTQYIIFNPKTPTP